MEKTGVPVIDMQKLEGLEEELVKGCEEWGCFRMANHGVPVELMSEMKAVVASLFDLPEEIKMRTVHPGLSTGYIQRNQVGPFFEGFSIDDVTSPDEFCDNLEVSPHQREIIYKYIKAVGDLAGLFGRKLMEGHGLEGDLLDGWLCQMRMNKYHFCPESVGSIGVYLHSDSSFLTILYDDEDVNGLQVVNKHSGEFVPVDPVPGTFAVNIGDMGKAWSNGRYCNVQHRVYCFEAKTRYSIAFLVWGPNDKKVEAPSNLVDEEHPRLYVPIDVKEYNDVRMKKGCAVGEALELYRTTTTD